MDFQDFIKDKTQKYSDWDEYIKNDHEACFYIETAWNYQQEQINKLIEEKEELIDCLIETARGNRTADSSLQARIMELTGKELFDIWSY